MASTAVSLSASLSASAAPVPSPATVPPAVTAPDRPRFRRLVVFTGRLP
jgi:hypothetical protein